MGEPVASRLPALHIAVLWASATAASAEPKVTAFAERLYPIGPIGAVATFLGVQQRNLGPTQASSTISFVYTGGLGTKLCFQILSRDGRYRATASIDMNQTVFGEARVDLKSKENSYITSLPSEEFAIDASYRDNCGSVNESSPRTIVWFGPDRPKGPVLLLFQAHDNDAYFLPDGSKPADRVLCAKVPQTSVRPATAFNTSCALESVGGQARLRGLAQVIDLASIPTKTIAVDVTLK
jgi:hypothetical protein